MAPTWRIICVMCWFIQRGRGIQHMYVCICVFWVCLWFDNNSLRRGRLSVSCALSGQSSFTLLIWQTAKYAQWKNIFARYVYFNWIWVSERVLSSSCLFLFSLIKHLVNRQEIFPKGEYLCNTILIKTVNGAKINMECKHITASLMQNMHMIVLYSQ